MKTVNQTTLPTVWQIGEQVLENSTKYSITFNGTTDLVIRNVSVDKDNGTLLTCSDPQGIITSSTTLIVSGKTIMMYPCMYQ